MHWSEGRPAHWSGLERCASIWACPVCSAVIRHGRALEIQEAADRWAVVGGGVLMLTLTQQHTAEDALEDTLDRILSGWRDLQMHRGFKALKKRLGVQGIIRSVEVTWSWSNGWHPHAHALLFTEQLLTEPEMQALESETFDLWQTVVMKRGGRPLDRRHGVRASRGGAAEYVAKVQEHDAGTGLEMARLDLKRGRGGSLMPFEFLDSPTHRARWIEYVQQTQGRRAITWSRGLRVLLGLDAEQSDEEVIAETETSDLVALLDAQTYDGIKHDPERLAQVLENAEDGKEVLG